MGFATTKREDNKGQQIITLTTYKAACGWKLLKLKQIKTFTPIECFFNGLHGKLSHIMALRH